MDNNNNEKDQKQHQHDGNDDYDGRRITDEDLIKEIISAPKETVFQIANRLVEEKTADSLVLDPTVDSMIPKFDEAEIRLGRVLGRGGFCIVQEIDKVKIPGMKSSSSGGGGGSSIGSFLFRQRSSSMYEDDAGSNGGSINGSRYSYSDVGGRGGIGGLGDSDRSNNKDEDATNTGAGGRRQQRRTGGAGGDDEGGSDRFPRMSRMSLARLSRKKTAIIGGGGGSSRSSRRPFAFKQVNTELQYGDNRMNYMKGIVDLAMEAKFLANLDHPNIIGLCGISRFGASEFIIIDKLSMTLSQKFKDWMKIDRQCKGITGLFTGSKHKIYELNTHRYMVAIEIASACQYLHERNIIFRDLKPDNIGFDSNGTVKLFDFGLAKELKKKDQVVQSTTKDDGNDDNDGNDNENNNGLVVYNLTGVTGAIRYMSPENALNKPYNLSSDVWSFSMILWFILALEPPFGFYTESMILDRVLKRGSRPAVFDSWPNHIKDILKRSWKTNLIERPTFKEICIKLKHVLSNSNGSGGGGGIDHTTTAAAAAAAIAPGTTTELSAQLSACFSLASESESGLMGVGGVGSKSG